MKSKVYKSSLAKHILLALGLVVLPLSVVSQTQAKAPGRIPGKPTIAVVYIGDHPGMNINNAADLKARLLRVIARNAKLNPKLAKEISKSCGCAAVTPQELSGFGGCMKSCLSDLGASYFSIIMCGVACAAAGTGVGALACAVCVGLHVTGVEACAIACAMRYSDDDDDYVAQAPRTKRGHATSGSLQAKLRPRPAKGKS